MKYALIIGNNKYDDPKLAQLKTPAADSQALAKVLADKNIGSFDEVTPLVNKTESEIRRAISGFLANKKPDDLVLVYFSGHGILDDRGRLFLSLKDTETTLLKATAIPSTFISDEMDSCRSKRQVLILDCCHSGAFARGTKGEQKAVTEATFEGSGYGRVVMTASDSTQYALEGDQVITQTDLSLFTHFLLEGLKTGEADIDHDGHISLDEWYDYTYARVISETPKQIPHRWSYNQQGDLIIARNPNARKRVVELPFELAQAVESPFTTIRESALTELGKLLRSRDPEMATLARLSLEKMRGDDSRKISSLAEKLLLEFEPPLPKPVVDTEPETASVAKEDATPSPTMTAEIESPSYAGTRTSQPNVKKSSLPVNRPLASQQLVFDRSFWTKWIMAIIPAILFSTMFFFYNLPADIPDVIFIGMFMAVTGSSSTIQWFAFRENLKYSWIAANLAAGLALGSFHIYLYAQGSDWWGVHLSLLLSLWVLGNFGIGSMIIKDSQGDPQKPAIIENVRGSNVFLILLSASLIIGAISNVLLVWDLAYEALRICWMLYGAAAILTGLSFILKKEIPRNIGFITLALFLALDGINVERLAFDSEIPQYFFALNGIMALVSGVYFGLQRETWKNFGFILFSGYLITTGAAGMSVYDTTINHAFLLISAIFALPAAVSFFLRKK